MFHLSSLLNITFNQSHPSVLEKENNKYITNIERNILDRYICKYV